MSNESLINNYIEHYSEIINRCDTKLLSKIHASAEKHSLEISNIYFDVLYNTDEGKNLFTKALIDEELVPKLAAWLPDIFEVRVDQKEIIDYINLQFAVGKKYVRMNIPSHLLNLGSRVLKFEICKRVIGSDCVSDEVRAMYTQIIMLVDLCLSITYEAYIRDKISIERRSQALQTHILSSELAVMCQSIRADMHDWHTLLLNKILASDSATINSLPSIKKSEFSLWLGHKANIFFSDSKEIDSINNEIDLIDNKTRLLIELHNNNDKEKLQLIIGEINEHIKQVSWLLTALTELAHSQESGKDTLTKLYNRRYLDVILQKETHYAISTNQSFLILMIDIDNFKTINDTYGHVTGDNIIEMVANTLYDSIRSSDYIFRYGGDEFLILLVDTSIGRSEELASKLIQDINHNKVETENNVKIQTSISIGIALSGNSTDYQNIISKADKALFDAKEKGRNCYSVVH